MRASATSCPISTPTLKADDRVDEKRVGVRAAEHAVKQRDAVANREQRHVEPHIAEAEEKEDDTEEEEQMVVASDHVFGAQVEKRHQAALLHEGAIGRRHAVRNKLRWERCHEREGD